VLDFGLGVGPETRRKLFRPVHRSAEAAAQDAPGVGLGLALSRQMARRMGGDLRLERSRGEGAVFVVELRTRA
jgi:signal transduction histidine kinase